MSKFIQTKILLTNSQQEIKLAMTGEVGERAKKKINKKMIETRQKG